MVAAVAVMMDAGDRILHVCSEQTSAAFFHKKKQGRRGGGGGGRGTIKSANATHHFRVVEEEAGDGLVKLVRPTSINRTIAMLLGLLPHRQERWLPQPLRLSPLWHHIRLRKIPRLLSAARE